VTDYSVVLCGVLGMLFIQPNLGSGWNELFTDQHIEMLVGSLLSNCVILGGA
jgi:hypothetical protein